ncbi:MAG: sulfotransferase family protein [Pseudomonadales bacterium]|jgi:hypothetical protein|nr:sulfotransferase family protein [Pseudomonadales bacterium]HMW14425.1 sulfotransferase [Pseudomonadales bacterium]HNC76065.1 sulfotransferase [Pseudomonadales bacterium]HNF73867.1 sulfotransferase [Pseudomonadales bacterium]HNH70362.1 sulfotransferase [Pseudomonadales bacterium]
MSIKVIGAGFGRTGTLSFKQALEQLGFNPCYHMLEVFNNPTHIPQWQAAAEGRLPDWKALLNGYQAAVDWPVCAFWRELTEAFPQAKVVLTLRDPQKWYQSIISTIYQTLIAPSSTDESPQLTAHRAMTRQLILQNTFDGRLDDPTHAIAVYQRHIETVKSSLSPRQLLVYEVAQGWEPLCEFLECPVPDSPFPQVNSTEEFQTRMLNRRTLKL